MYNIIFRFLSFQIPDTDRRRYNMDDVLVPGSNVDMEFIEQNPEAIFGKKVFLLI